MSNVTQGPWRDDGTTITLSDVLEATGATYRQVDYWARCGYLDGATRMDDAADLTARLPGSGQHRVWTQRDIEVIRAIRALSKVLLPEHARRCARLAVDTGATEATIEEVFVSWGDLLTGSPDSPTEQDQPEEK